MAKQVDELTYRPRARIVACPCRSRPAGAELPLADSPLGPILVVSADRHDLVDPDAAQLAEAAVEFGQLLAAIRAVHPAVGDEQRELAGVAAAWGKRTPPARGRSRAGAG